MSTKIIVLPHTYAQWPICDFCFQQRPDAAMAALPGTASLVRCCGTCYHTECAGQGPRRLTVDELRQTWPRLARLAVNEEIDEILIGRALARYAPHLSAEDAAAAYEDLADAIVRRQAYASGEFDWTALEPDLRDRLVLEQMAESDLQAALRTLIGEWSR